MITEAELTAIEASPVYPENCGHNQGRAPGACRDCREEIDAEAGRKALGYVARLAAEIRRARGAVEAERERCIKCVERHCGDDPARCAIAEIRSGEVPT